MQFYDKDIISKFCASRGESDFNPFGTSRTLCFSHPQTQILATFLQL